MIVTGVRSSCEAIEKKRRAPDGLLELVTAARCR
jgi:hypothetical protein